MVQVGIIIRQDRLSLFLILDKPMLDLPQDERDLIPHMFNFYRYKFDGIYYTNFNDVKLFDGKSESIEYQYWIANPELSEELKKYNKKIFKTTNELEDEMANLPLKMWSINALKDELKRLKVAKEDYEDIDDKNILVEMIGAAQKGKVISKKIVPEKKNLKDKKSNDDLIADPEPAIKDKFSKLSRAELIKYKFTNKLDCKLLKTDSDEDMRNKIRSIVNKKITGANKTNKEVTEMKKTDVKADAKKVVSKKVITKKGVSDKNTDVPAEKKQTVLSSTKAEELEKLRAAKRKKRELERKNSISDAEKAKIKEFKAKYADKKISYWREKMKKAFPDMKGIQFLSGYNIFKILANKGATQKKYLKVAQEKIGGVYSINSELMKIRSNAKKKAAVKK